MKFRLLLTIVAVFFAHGITGHTAAIAVDRYVVLISVDGLAATYLDDPRAELPVLRKLARQGAVAKGMITSFPSVTWPSHVSLVTGAKPAKHGVIGNSTINRKTGKEMKYIGDTMFTKEARGSAIEAGPNPVGED